MKFSHYLIFSTSFRHLKDWSLQDFCTDSGERLPQCEEPWGALRQPLQITPTVGVHITLAVTVHILRMPIIAQSIKYKYLNNPANTVLTINEVQPSWACSDCHVSCREWWQELQPEFLELFQLFQENRTSPLEALLQSKNQCENSNSSI